MAKKNKQIADDYASYRANMDGTKQTNPQLIVKDPKANHSRSYYGQNEVDCDVKFGNTTIGCEVREENEHNYSISYFSDQLSTKVMFRLDVGNGTHYNRVPDIPLDEASIPTPHYHEYRQDGRMIAYKIPGINYDEETSLLFDMSQGYDYFCNKLNLTSNNGDQLNIVYAPAGLLPFVEDSIDPNENVEFP